MQCLPQKTTAMGGYLAHATMNTCANRCSSMLLPPARVNTTVLSVGPERTITQTRPGGGTYCHGICSPQLHPRRCRGLYWDIYQLCRLLGRGQCEEAIEECLHRKFSTPSRNASDSSGHLHSQRGNGGSHWPVFLGLIHIQSLPLLTNEL